MPLPSDRLLPERGSQQALLHDLAGVLAEGGAAPFLSNVLVQPDARFFPEAGDPGGDPVHAMHHQIFAYAGVPHEAPSVGSEEFDSLLRPEAEGTTDMTALGPVCRRAARAWRRRQGLASGGTRAPRLVDLTAVCLGFGALLANEELARTGVDGERTVDERDPSVDWRRKLIGAGGGDLGRLLGAAGLDVRPTPLTATELVFALAAQVVVRHPTAWSRRGFGRVWQVRTLDRELHPVFVLAIRALATPKDSLAAQLDFRSMPKARRRIITLLDGSEHFRDFNDLLGVERILARRPGLLARILGSWTARLRCSSKGCAAPLPAWSPQCVVCGRGVKGELPLVPRGR